MGTLSITLELGNWYKVIYADGQVVVFRFLGQAANGDILIELPDGTRGTLDMNRPFIAIM